uniref:14-3-3 domain-containing protein n=1 Tax=Ciona savignyi TaxID=51511 RepID=H2ZEP2_CIOSA
AVPEDPEKARLVESARLAEQAERYDDMVENMKKVMRQQSVRGACIRERNLLSVAFKNVVGARRSSWRVISSIKQKEEEEKKVKLSEAYLTRIANEIEEICIDVVNLIDTSLLCRDDLDVESKTFYMKMKGDYYRYVAEVSPQDSKSGFADKANKAYDEAYTLCKAEMPASHPIRLGLALNYSVFYYEILAECSAARTIAQKAFDDAIQSIDELPPNTYKDSTLIMQLLRDNITLWSSDMEDDDDDSAQQQKADGNNEDDD